MLKFMLFLNGSIIHVSNSLIVALDDANGLDGRTSEVPHPKAGVLR